MGKKKKFIDKKNAVSFRLVHRSQRDPLQADEDSSKHVLLPVGNTELSHDQTHQATGYQGETVEERKKEQRDYGVFYEDDYDYLQHLKPRTDTTLEPLPDNVTVIEAKKSDVKKFGKVSLPREVFASGHEEKEGILNLAVPISGPQPDWDPDIVAALDDAIDLNDPENILDDDFILQANESFEEDSDIEGSNERVKNDEYNFPSDGDYDDDDNDSFDFGDDDDDEDIKSRFSNYSMTSSVIRRTEGLCLLDDRFDKIMEEYEDDEIGALDHEEVTGDRSLNDPLLESIKNEINDKEVGGSEAVTMSRVRFDIPENERSGGEDDGFTRITEVPKEEWDCESVLSTYSNLYNHPALIKESSQTKDSGAKRINLSKREGIPLGVLSDGIKNKGCEAPQTNQSEESQPACHVRSRGETREEKKTRKQLVKQEKQARRVEKKTNKLLFKEERKRQEKSQSSLVIGQKLQ
ncbi:protein LTV1 homolog [Dendronephthya gigantea]|uniref:protein LTV1 homolog n=1 Tax=Dendronephthya gigantea TaxID=151771 RepID=UPI0010696F3E|nr:protein LTV1 homolog [Dendronephthya gigantea]